MRPEDGHRRFRAGEDEIIDLTAFDAGPGGWRTASTDATVVDAAGRSSRWRRSAAVAREVPKGTKHAFRPSDPTTACGLPVAELHTWADHHFGDGLLNRCPSCVDRIRAPQTPLLGTRG